MADLNSSPDVFVVIPTYQEAGNIGPLVEELYRVGVAGLYVCVVDDASPDGTGNIVLGLRPAYPSLHLIARSGHRGYGLACRDGIAFALERGASFIVTMDADFSHQPAVIPEMLRAAAQGDLVVGSRYAGGGSAVKDWPRSRLMLSKAASLLVRVVSQAKLRDTTSGFRCWRASFLRSLPLDTLSAGGFAFIYETLFLAAARGARIAEVRNVYTGRSRGDSKLTAGIMLEGLLLCGRFAWKRLSGRVP